MFVEEIKEIANQLKDLYGFTQLEMMPTILKCIAVDSAYTCVCLLVFAASFILIVANGLAIFRKKELSEREDFDVFFFRRALLFVFSVCLSLLLSTVANKAKYIFMPEIAIVEKLIK